MSFIKTHSNEGRGAKGPENILFAGASVTLSAGKFLQAGAVKGLSEGTSDAGGLGWIATHNQTAHTVHRLADEQHHSKYLTQAQQGPESPTVTLTWHACKYKVHKLHQRRYINSTRGTSSSLVEFMYLVFTRMPGESYCR